MLSEKFLFRYIENVYTSLRKNNETNMSVQPRNPFPNFIALVASLTNREMKREIKDWTLKRGVQFDSSGKIWAYPFEEPQKVIQVWNQAQRFSIGFLWFKKRGDYISQAVRYEGSCLKAAAAGTLLDFDCKRMEPRASFATHSVFVNSAIDREIATAGLTPFMPTSPRV